MRYSLYFAWFVAVVSICVFTTLASLPGFTTVERPAEPDCCLPVACIG